MVDKSKLAIATSQIQNPIPFLIELLFNLLSQMITISTIKLTSQPVRFFIDDTRGVEKYKKVQDLNWNGAEKNSGKIIKIKGFPLCKKVKIFWIMCLCQQNRIYCY